ncbi:MAG: hypothetical protein ACEQSK_04600 [Sphingomonadaceae bacterium]
MISRACQVLGRKVSRLAPMQLLGMGWLMIALLPAGRRQLIAEGARELGPTVFRLKMGMLACRLKWPVMATAAATEP